MEYRSVHDVTRHIEQLVPKLLKAVRDGKVTTLREIARALEIKDDQMVLLVLNTAHLAGLVSASAHLDPKITLTKKGATQLENT